MTETLLSSSNVLLFGRVVQDLEINQPDHDPFVEPRAGVGHQLLRQLSAEGARLARIYGFSYAGTYYDLPHPTMFLVHGEGVPAETAAAENRVARSPDDPSRTGLAAPKFSFADGLQVWSYDKADYTIRMDVETGTFEQVLIEAGFDGGSGMSGSRVSGSRVSGSRLSGSRLSGSRLSGSRVSGSRVGGHGDASD
jgi:hypothetical protein